MEWTKPLSVLLVVLVAVMIVGALVELFRTTFADPNFLVASAVTIALVSVVVLGVLLAGIRNRRWITNPDAYW